MFPRRQAKWMKNRFLAENREAPPVYRVDSSDPARWQENCLHPAAEILTAYLEGRLPALAPLARFSVAGGAEDEHKKTFHCDLCRRDLLGGLQYKAHMAGARHRKMAKSLAAATRPQPQLLLREVGPECSRQEAARLLKSALGWPLNAVLAALDGGLPSELGRVGPRAKAEGLVKSLAARGLVLELISEKKEDAVELDSGIEDSKRLCAS